MRSDMAPAPLSLDDVQRAGRALDALVIRTPVLENPDVNAMLGGRLLLKAENMQRPGAFKIRRAYHRMLGLDASDVRRGAVHGGLGGDRHAL